LRTQVGGCLTVDSGFALGGLARNTALSGEPVTSVFTSRRVLIVDDNQDHARTLAELVALMGHEVEFTFDSTKALQKAIEFRPDVAFLDIGMPVLDGYGVARLLRQQFGEHIRIVAISGYGSGEHRKAARSAGFDAHLAKPVEAAMIEHALAVIFDPAIRRHGPPA
jgi:CheY-like chemotaxis protein